MPKQSVHSMRTLPVARGRRHTAPDIHTAIIRQAGLCAEAQADGVPCFEAGRLCEVCERALSVTEDEAW